MSSKGCFCLLYVVFLCVSFPRSCAGECGGLCRVLAAAGFEATSRGVIRVHYRFQVEATVHNRKNNKIVKLYPNCAPQYIYPTFKDKGLQPLKQNKFEL